MEIKIMKTTEFDRLILVSRDKLMDYVNQEDLCCRESRIIEDAYHKDWFYQFNGFTYFTPPAASIRDGTIYFINGRHRTILLTMHLSQFPFLIGNIDLDHFGGTPKTSSLKAFESIRLGDLEEHSAFILPDLKFGPFKSDQFE